MPLTAAAAAATSTPGACRAQIVPRQLHRAAHTRRRTAPVVRAAAETELERPASSTELAAAAAADPPAVQLSGRVAVLQASKQAALDVEEAGRPLGKLTAPEK